MEVKRRAPFQKFSSCETCIRVVVLSMALRWCGEETGLPPRESWQYLEPLLAVTAGEGAPSIQWEEARGATKHAPEQRKASHVRYVSPLPGGGAKEDRLSTSLRAKIQEPQTEWRERKPRGNAEHGPSTAEGQDKSC